MEYIYTVMLLNSLKKEVNETNIQKVLESVGVSVDTAKIKSIIAALDGVDISKVIEESQNSFVSSSVAAPVSSEAVPSTETKKEEKKEDKPSTDDAAAGLGSLF
jgi:ribosomal protein L12E/L44/L45/RPP1/RPP2